MPDFHVENSLPNVTFPLTRSFAGNIPVKRQGHPNNTLFFWAFEKDQGSLTREAKDDDNEPWMIWLNGGQFKGGEECEPWRLSMISRAWIIEHARALVRGVS